MFICYNKAILPHARSKHLTSTFKNLSPVPPGGSGHHPSLHVECISWVHPFFFFFFLYYFYLIHLWSQMNSPALPGHNINQKRPL